ncbi:hypothetical protein EDB81DRAFT_880231 [Dactylonectria macrodidyma]|uniref:NACHT domain-containing protein n=1 Tax=Dactylonectria macrodidyma TaxID=307937 RepID=A0A9P9JDC5_9HYPO|nr:hypothetical protein EDB81DRAFT_880231 [Dactylonectria macrodidyma]
MDPLTALGLAAAVVQFVGFASHLVSKTKDIQESATGQSKQAATLETVYSQLQHLSSRLELSSRRDPRLEIVEGSTDLVKHVFAINDLSRICEGDCQRLLDIVRKLKVVDESSRRWQSFRVALKTIWKGNEISDLEQRLHNTQTTLTLHVCSLTSYWHQNFDRHLRELRSESRRLNAQQSGRLDGIARMLGELSERVAASRSSSMPNMFTSSDIENLEAQMAQLSLFKAAAAKEHLILKSLSFDSRPIRYSSIPEAHSRTFEWAFEGHQSRSKGNTATGGLLTWLREGDGFFWVSGKPGSGKSTFMKFVADHPSTLAALTRWTSPRRTVLASHYFWSAGTPMQKSQQGLLQSLLYDIFRQLPDLIESACIERWQKTMEQLSYKPWLVPELQRVLKRIASQDVAAKFCFLIDGLDEFEGDHVDFCRSLHDLAQSPHVKFCISSRAWNVFEDSFGRVGASKLYIHELTRDDIRSYVERRLQDHPRWMELDAEVSNAVWLIEEITERAAGVFLWVFLATGQLRNGLTEYDTFSDMQRRLESIPVDLEAFFKQILQSVEPFYHEKMASTLQIALEAREPAPVAVYGFHDLEYEDENYALERPLRALSMEEAATKRKQITRRLNGRCRGLLEVNLLSQRVEFLHRSVMDFLRTRDMCKFLLERAPRNFNANLSLLRGYTAYIKNTDFPEFVDRTAFAQFTSSPLISALEEAVAQARELDKTTDAYPLLDELDRCVPEMHRKGQAKLNVWGNPSNPVALFLRELVVKNCLVGYLNHTLPSQPNYFIDFEKPVLTSVVESLIIHCTSLGQFGENIEMLRCLLENGCDPNTIYYDVTRTKGRKRTPWKDLADLLSMPAGLYSLSHVSSSFRQTAIEDGRPLMLMLKYGANSDTCLSPPTAVFLDANNSRDPLALPIAQKRVSEPIHGDELSRKRSRPK